MEQVVERLEGTVERFVPQIDRDNRISLVDRVQSSSNWDFDFFALMVLSTIIAAIGLEQNSAAVVIGAMLIAPLMTPIIIVGGIVGGLIMGAGFIIGGFCPGTAWAGSNCTACSRGGKSPAARRRTPRARVDPQGAS